MERSPLEGQGQDSREVDEGRRLALLQALSPSTARIFKELQNPSISREEFFRKIGEYNDVRRSMQPPVIGAYQTVSAEVSPTRKVWVDFSRTGYINLQGSEYSEEKK